MTLTELAPPGRAPDDSLTSGSNDAAPPTQHPPLEVTEPRAPRFGRPTRNGWITIAIGALATVLYTWGLSKVGYGNSYYAAAVKSASVNWKAFFFGSIDSGNFITVDKPPAALWIQALSVRAFGFNSWSMLLPEAACGVASVLLLGRLVRKWAGDAAGHLAALALAVTPIAVAMFRFNNPDAFLTVLGLAAAAALWKAIESGRTRWLALSGALVGLAFQAKMMQAFLIIPAFIVVYLWAGKPKLGRRIGQLAVALASLVASAGWWIAIVALWPAATRPYIGSTQDNSILSLVFGYNGLSRLFGSTGTAGGAPGGGGAMFGGTAGIFRLFNSVNGGQISWLLPIALVGLVAGLWLTRRNPRTDQARAGWLLWGGWTLGCALVFSLSSGIFHPYYSVQLAPGIAALTGAGSIALWKLGRRHRFMRWVLPAMILVSAALSVILLQRTSGYMTWLVPLIVGGAALAAAGLWMGDRLRSRLMVLGAAGVATATLLAGPLAYSVTTVLHPITGSLVSAGPSSSSGGFGRGGGGGESTTTDTALVTYLEANQGDATYLAAGFGSGSTEGLIIATGKPVMTIGGFSGSDPAPTLAQFKALVANGAVKYVIVSGGGFGGGFGGGGGRGGDSGISSWVTSNGTAVTISGSSSTVYDVSGAV